MFLRGRENEVFKKNLVQSKIRIIGLYSLYILSCIMQLTFHTRKLTYNYRIIVHLATLVLTKFFNVEL